MAPVNTAKASAATSTTRATAMLRRRCRCLSSGAMERRLAAVALSGSGLGAVRFSSRRTGCGMRRPRSPLVPGTGLVEVCPCSRASIRLRRSWRSFSALFTGAPPPFLSFSKTDLPPGRRIARPRRQGWGTAAVPFYKGRRSG